MEEREGEEEERRYHHILIRLPADADDPQLIHRLRDEVAGALSITGGGKDGSLPEVTAVTLKQKDDPEATQQYDCALSFTFRDAAAASAFRDSTMNGRVRTALRPFLSSGGTILEVGEAGAEPAPPTRSHPIVGFLESAAVYAVSTAVVSKLIISRL